MGLFSRSTSDSNSTDLPDPREFARVIGAAVGDAKPKPAADPWSCIPDGDEED